MKKRVDIYTQWVYYIVEVIIMELRELRAQLGDTQSEFAGRYGIPFRTVQNWEAGIRKPPEYMINLLERRVREDMVNRKTISLPKYDPRKDNLPGIQKWNHTLSACAYGQAALSTAASAAINS